MLTGWKSSQWKKVRETHGVFTLSVVLKSHVDGFEWAITNVRQYMWNEFRGFSQSISGAWVVAGDFNVIRFAHERCGRRAHYQDIAEFRGVIRELELMDKEVHLV